MSLLAIGIAAFTLGCALFTVQAIVWLYHRVRGHQCSADLAPAIASLPAAIFSITFWDVFLLLLGLSILSTMLLSMSKDIMIYLPGFIMSFICGLCAYVYRQ